MKVRKKHKVPLSDEAISIIELMRKKHNHEHVFTNPATGRHISNGAMLIFLKKQLFFVLIRYTQQLYVI